MDRLYQLAADRDPWLKAKLEDIKNHPEKHRHTLEELHECSMNRGALDMLVWSAHEDMAPVGTNAGVRCDVVSGPCSCGATHALQMN
jgi:hypothetical protein